MCVCVWLILSTHVFLYGDFCEFFLLLLNKLSSLRDVGSWDLTLKSFCLILIQANLFPNTLSFYGLIFK